MVTRNIEKNRFELEQEGLVAVADYVLSPGVMTVTHVIVPVPLRGQGVASTLAEAVIAAARAENLKMVPQCSFMEAYFRRHPEYSDLLQS